MQALKSDPFIPILAVVDELETVRMAAIRQGVFGNQRAYDLERVIGKAREAIHYLRSNWAPLLKPCEACGKLANDGNCSRHMPVRLPEEELMTWLDQKSAAIAAERARFNIGLDVGTSDGAVAVLTIDGLIVKIYRR